MLKKLFYPLAFWPYAAIISAYFGLLVVLSLIGFKPTIRLVEKPDLLSRGFVHIWNIVPPKLKIWLSTQNKLLYEKKFTKFYIDAYLHRNYTDEDYLQKFKPPHGKIDYECFQDFFTRDFKEVPLIKADSVSPAEGLVCDKKSFEHSHLTSIKGDQIGIRTIFGSSADKIPKHYHFTNIYLSNRNYHHIHAPVSGQITKVEKIHGDLIVLRPWYYRDQPSKPAISNERINIDITDHHKQVWFLSIVGGPVVNSILLANEVSIGQQVEIGQKISSFELGSTCCVASPQETKVALHSSLDVFQDF